MQVVATKYDTATAAANDHAWHDEVQDWCLEHHFEFIRTAAGHQPTDTSLARYASLCVLAALHTYTSAATHTHSHSGGEDPEGVPRVRAALEAHLWPGLQRKDPADAAKGPPDRPPPTNPLSEEEEEEEGDVARQAAEMDALFAEVLSAREAMHGMGDDARREAAARLALRLADAFGLEDEEGSDEE